MSGRKEDQPEEESPEDIEEKTRILMEQAIQEGVPLEDEKPGETSFSDQGMSQVDETFERIKVRMDDILSNIEDSLSNTEPEIEKQLEGISQRLSEKLKGAGLGVFANRAVSIVNQELKQNLSIEKILKIIQEAISDAKEQVEDVLTKASRGTAKTIGKSTGSLQERLLRLYASINETEKNLELAQAEARKWRSKAKELETQVQQKNVSMVQLQEEIDDLKTSLAEAKKTVSERNDELSATKGELSQAQSQIEQQRNLIEKLDTAADLVEEFEHKSTELAEARGRISELEEITLQKEKYIQSLQDELAKSKGRIQTIESENITYSSRIANLEGEITSLEEEFGSAKADVAEMQARWEMLYQVAEDEPAFKAYFVVAGKTHWFPIQHLSSALGVPMVLLKRQLQKFIDAGLVEIQDDKIRPMNLSEVAKNLAGMDEEAIKEVTEQVDTSTEDEETGQAEENNDTD